MIHGIGVDIIEIHRIKHAVERWGDSFLNHVFTEQEIAWAKGHKHPFQHYAGRFAAKEAIFKALGDDRVVWKDLMVLNDAQGKPQCTLFNSSFKGQIFISISHCKDYAVAHAVVTQ